MKWRPFVSGGVDLRKKRARLGQRGAVMVELLIAYIPVLFCFLAFWQLSELLVAQMVVARASSAAGRAAAVVLADDPMFYAGEATRTLGGKREGDVRLAAGMMLAASPHIAEDFQLHIGNVPEDVGAMEVAVAANFRCDRLRFVCGADGVVSLKATSSHTYHGAKYQYEPTDLSSAASGDLFVSGDASCKDGDPASNGKGGKGGDGSGGSGGRGNGGSGGTGGRGGSGGEGSTRGNDLCGPGSTQNADGTCSSNQCAKEPNPRKRKRCEEEQCKPGETKDSFGKCCKSPDKLSLKNGSPANLTSCTPCKPQEPAKDPASDGNHVLTGNIEVGGYQLDLPDGIKPDEANICGTTCSSPGKADGQPEDVVANILDGLQRKSLEYLCESKPGKKKSDPPVRNDESLRLSKRTGSEYASFFNAVRTWCDARAQGVLPAQEKDLYKAVDASLDGLGKDERNSVRTGLRYGSSIYHTEPKVIELLDVWSTQQKLDLKDVTMDLSGTWSPCASCSTKLQQFVKQHGGEVKYCWTKGIYTQGVARDDSFVLGNGKLQGGTIDHQGCVTFKKDQKPSFSSTGLPLCPASPKKKK